MLEMLTIFFCLRSSSHLDRGVHVRNVDNFCCLRSSNLDRGVHVRRARVTVAGIGTHLQDWTRYMGVKMTTCRFRR